MRSLNQFRKIILVCVITAAAMFFAVPAAQTAYADTQAPVKYVDENGTEHQVNSYTVLKNDMTEIGSADGTWYVVNENVTFENNLKVKDNAKAYIILCDGKKMRCKDNFTVNETSELTIWGQKETSGELESSGGYFSAYAAIGGAPDHSNGLIEIHSGYVNAHLGGSLLFNRGAAIGAGNGADGGVIRILGGKVHAYTEGAGTGIGGGHKGGSGKIHISGGDVTGHSKAEGAGIGSGDEAGDNAKGEIIITGGKVDAHGEIGAGIGGGDHTSGGTITISGGTVDAYASDGTWEDAGAAIGGGNEADAGVINITGGTITAKSSTGAGTAIGCGEDCEGETTGEIYISGGTVNATAKDGSESAGIGGGNGANGCHIVIRGGDITANGGSSSMASLYSTNGGAGIGGGDSSKGGEIEIYGGKVTAIGGSDAAGIGGGDHGNGGSILIAGGEVTAITHYGGAGIGGGEAATGGNITISGGIVNAQGGGQLAMSGAGIGGGDGASGSAAGETIHITGGNVTAYGMNEAAGIGGGDDGGGANVIIDGGTVTAQGGKYAAGIGTGQKPSDDRKGDGSLTINGGNVTAKGGTDGAGIGGGENADGLKTTINGGYVYAEGKSYGAGIGGGENCKGGDVTITGGTVIAKAGDDCNGKSKDGGCAIGCGQGIDKPDDPEDSVYGKLTIDGLMVKGGDNKDNLVLSSAAERKPYVHWRNYAQINSCTHEGAATFEKDENGHKIQGCPYCGMNQGEIEAHKYQEGLCKVCGYKQPRDLTVTFEPGEHGTGTMEAYQAYPGEMYPLPKYGFEPEDGYAFTGWSVNGSMKKTGNLIKIDENTTVTAVWKNTDGDAWIKLMNQLPQGGTITLENDVKAPLDLSRNPYPLDVDRGSVKLDLNGYTLDRNIKARATRGPVITATGTGNLTLMNGQLIGANVTGVGVGQNGSLIMKDCTVTDNNGYAIWISDNGSLSIEGTIKLSGNEDGGVWVEKGCKINISGPLSKDSVIPISLRNDGEGKVEPTKETPVVLTSGLKDKGDVECFTSDEDRYRIGVDANGEAVIGFPTSISFDKGDGTADEEHSMSDAPAVCGAVYTLPACGYEPPEKYVFQGWKVEGSDKVLPAGDKVTVTENMKLTACYVYAPQAVTVMLETGEGHEAIAQKIAETFNANKEGSAEAGGSIVNIRMLENMTITDAEEKICAIMQKADISYDGEDGKSGRKWTGTVGRKTLSGYESYSDHEQAEMQNTPGHGGDPIGGIEDPQIKFYVHWNEPVTEIDLTIDEPVCGTEIKLDESGKPDVTPKAELTGAQPSADAVAKMQSLWNTSDGRKAFEGTITGGEQYETAIGIEPAFGYYIPENAEISVNGQALEAGQISAVNNAVELRANMTAEHAYGEDPAPVWTWNGYESATATFTCTVDPSHVTTLTDDEIYREVKREASHTKEGIVNYTAAIEYGGGVYPNTITQLLPKTDHEWGAADYTWMDDNHRVLAKRQCQLEPSHFETEVAQTSSEVTREATCTEAGTTKYTADFANEAFSQQIKEEADIPALGHDWLEWTETTPATEDAAGEEARACSRCPETQTRIIPPKDHRHGLRHIAAKAATCTENGWAEYYVCDRGDHPCHRYYADAEGVQSIDDPFIPALGHNYQVEWEWSDDNTSAALSYVCLNDEADAGTVAAEVRVEETPASCEKAGKKLYRATVANGPGEKTYTDVREAETPASGHKWGEWKNFDADQHQRVCSNDPSHIEKENHNWNEGEVTVYPTVIREGVRTYTCQSCQTTRTEVIPKITPETPVPFTDGMVTLDAETFVYNGSVQKPEVQVAYAGETLDPGSYSVTCSDENSTNAGEYTVTVKMGKDSCFTDDPVTKTYIIEKASNTMTVKAAAKKVKLKKVKKKNQTVTALTVKGRQGKVTYKGTPVGKKAKKALKINAKTGKITVKKKTKKGTYKMKVTVTAAGNDNYNAKVQTVTVKIRVK